MGLTFQLSFFPLSNEANSKWLDAHYDPMANIHTFSSCLCESLDISRDTQILGGWEEQGTVSWRNL
jgi:hypothetical protein